MGEQSSSLSDPVVVGPTPLPWTQGEALDHDKLARNVERWSATSLSGFVVGSGAGEERYVSQSELIAATRTVASARGPGKLVIGGIDNPSVTESIRQADCLAGAGADLIRVRIPQTVTGGNRGGNVSYFEEVVAASPVPVIVIHQTWQTGGHAATPEEIGAICSLDDVAAYVCWHDLRFESYVRRFVPERVRFWAPNGSLLLPSVLIGAGGACCFFADWAPDLVRRILRLALDGKIAEAGELQRAIVRADFLGMARGVAALKAGLNLLGYQATIPRRPTAPLSTAETDDLAEAFREAGILG